jgi:hypothetical protein
MRTIADSIRMLMGSPLSIGGAVCSMYVATPIPRYRPSLRASA